MRGISGLAEEMLASEEGLSGPWSLFLTNIQTAILPRLYTMLAITQHKEKAGVRWFCFRGDKAQRTKSGHQTLPCKAYELFTSACTDALKSEMHQPVVPNTTI